MTTHDKFERLEGAITRLAESQTRAWDAIGEIGQTQRIMSETQRQLAMTQHELAVRQNVLATDFSNLDERLNSLAKLVEGFIQAQQNGHGNSGG
ncbi:MAG TPA: hypothetical protein VMT20_19560 [Terriglobia bacterium]|nr:hypothetical protein [Terriglobia bacterium]